MGKLFFVAIALLVSVATPINGFYVQYFASAIVGNSLAPTSLPLFVASEGMKKKNIEKMIEKGKDFVEELTDGDSETIEIEAKEVPESLKKNRRTIKKCPRSIEGQRND